MINIDLYGSRYTLIPLMRNATQLKLEINKAYLGSSLTSQYAKTQRVDTKLIKKTLNKYEELEVMNDRLKLFRRFSKQTKSNTIIIDFLYEGYEIVNSDSGRLTLTSANQKIDKKSSENTILTKGSRINTIKKNMDNFIGDLETFDKVILNKLRISKYVKNEDNNLILKDNIQEINIMNSIIETYEDLIINEIKTIDIIPLYRDYCNEGYWFSPDYLNHVKKYMTEFNIKE